MTEDDNPTHAKYQHIILEELAEFVMQELGAAMYTPSAEAWRDSVMQQRGFPFGWAPPMVIPMDEDELPLTLVPVCPELLATLTEHLDEEQLRSHLEIVKHLIDELVSNPDRPPGQVIREAEDVVYEIDPEALRLTSTIEARALDLGITAGPE